MDNKLLRLLVHSRLLSRYRTCWTSMRDPPAFEFSFLATNTLGCSACHESNGIAFRIADWTYIQACACELNSMEAGTKIRTAGIRSRWKFDCS